MNDPNRNPSDDRLEFLEALVEENASIAGDVVQVSEHLWAIHGFVPYDGEEVMAEFESYEEATIVLGQLPKRTQRRDEL